MKVAALYSTYTPYIDKWKEKLCNQAIIHSINAVNLSELDTLDTSAYDLFLYFIDPTPSTPYFTLVKDLNAILVAPSNYPLSEEDYEAYQDVLDLEDFRQLPFLIKKLEKEQLARINQSILSKTYKDTLKTVGHWELDMITLNMKLSEDFDLILGPEASQRITSLDRGWNYIHLKDRKMIQQMLGRYKDEEYRFNSYSKLRVVTTSGKIKEILNIPLEHNPIQRQLKGITIDLTGSSEYDYSSNPDDTLLNYALGGMPIGSYLLDEHLNFTFFQGKIFENIGIYKTLTYNTPLYKLDKDLEVLARQLAIGEEQQLITTIDFQNKHFFLHHLLKCMPSGEIKGFCFDITKHVELTQQIERSRKKLIESNQLLNYTQRITKTASIYYCQKVGKAQWSDAIKPILETKQKPKDRDLTYLMNFIHPEDQPLYQKEVIEVLKTRPKAKKQLDFVCRIIVPNDKLKYIHIVSETLNNHQDTVIITLKDITDKQKRIEQLKQRNAFHNLIYQDSLEAIAILDKDFKLLKANEKARQLFDLSADSDQCPHVHVSEFLDKEELQQKPLRQTEIFNGNAITDFRFIISSKNLRKLTHYTAKLMPNGTILVIFRDVTEKFNAQESIKRLHNLQNLSENMAQMGSRMIKVQSKEEVWSNQIFELLGLSPEKHIPSTDLYLNRIHPEDRGRIEQRLKALMAGQKGLPKNVKYRVIGKNDEVKILLCSALVEYINDKPSVIYFSNQDITQREKELYQIKNYSLILEQAYKITKLALIQWYPNTNHIDWTDGVYSLLEIEEGQLDKTLDSLISYIHPNDRTTLIEELEFLSLAAENTEKDYILRVIVNERVKYTKIWGKTVIENGVLVVYGVLQDITEEFVNQKRIFKLNDQLSTILEEQGDALEKAMFRLKMTFDNDLFGMAVLDYKNRFVEVNDTLCKMMDYKKTEIIGQEGLFFFHPSEIPSCIADMKKYATGEKDRTVAIKKLVRKDGKEIIGKLHISQVKGQKPEDTILIFMVEDTTAKFHLEQEREETLRQLKESVKVYRFLSESSTDLVAMHEPDGTYTFVNDAAEKILGFTKEELIGRSPYEFFHPDDQERIKKTSHEQLLKGNQEESSIIYRFKKKDGSYTWLDSRSKSILDDQGNLMGIHTYSRDINLFKAAENRMKIALEKERELNELRSQFVATASHQFRTPLASIKASAQYLELIADNPEFRDITKTINYESKRLTVLMDDILTLGRLDAKRLTPNPTDTDLKELTDKVIRQYLMIKKDNRVTDIVILGTPYTVEIDPDLMEHAIGNLVSNALKYSKGKPAPKIILDFQNQDKVKIQVQDYGLGIGQSDQKNLFKSFFRGQNVQDLEGTGLGLVISKQFIELNKGTIEVDSELYKGTTFTVELNRKFS